MLNGKMQETEDKSEQVKKVVRWEVEPKLYNGSFCSVFVKKEKIKLWESESEKQR